MSRSQAAPSSGRLCWAVDVRRRGRGMRSAVLGVGLAAICAFPSNAQGPTGTFAYGGWTSFLANGLSTTVVTISTSARELALVDCYNPNASPVYIQIFNAASG